MGLTNKDATVAQQQQQQQPNATLYIKNIDWKIKKGLLRRALYSLFTRHGKVLEIITLRKDGLRGQAFVIMDSIAAATAALHAEQGFTLFQKDMVIEYAHDKSDMIAKRDGDYIPKAQRIRLQQQQKNKMSTNTVTVVHDVMNPEVTDSQQPSQLPSSSTTPPVVIPEAPAPIAVPTLPIV
jgi:U2 small nuclear ribonucleoprotein B''